MNKKYIKPLVFTFVGLIMIISGFFIFETIFVNTITIEKEFDIKLNETKQTKDGLIKLKVDKIHPNESMGWGLGPYVEFTYNIKDKKGQYTLHYPVSAKI